MNEVPGYWMHETSGILRPAVEAYLRGGPMRDSQIAAMRAYLRQWIVHPVWTGEGVGELRDGIDRLTTRAAIAAWLNDADVLEIDPL